MFAQRYFSSRYFAPRYFPKVGDEGIDPTSPLPDFTHNYPNLLERFRDLLDIVRTAVT